MRATSIRTEYPDYMPITNACRALIATATLATAATCLGYASTRIGNIGFALIVILATTLISSPFIMRSRFIRDEEPLRTQINSVWIVNGILCAIAIAVSMIFVATI